MCDATRLDPPQGWTPATALVTGADGVLAARLISHLRVGGTQVVGLVAPDASTWRIPAGTSLVRGELHHADDVRSALGRFERAPEVCFHVPDRHDGGNFAELGLEPEANRVPALNAATQVIAEACLDHGVPALVFASTAAVLAPTNAPHGLDETARVGPITSSGRAALAAERTLRELAGTGRVGAAILRLFAVGGVGVGDANRDLAELWLIGRALRAASGRGEPVPLRVNRSDTDDGTAVRDHVHIDDLVDALCRSASLVLQRSHGGDAGVELFHLGSGVGRSARDILALVEEITGLKVPIVPIEADADSRPTPGRLIARPERLRRRLGMHPDGDVRRMIGDTAIALGMSRKLIAGCDDPTR